MTSGRGYSISYIKGVETEDVKGGSPKSNYLFIQKSIHLILQDYKNCQQNNIDTLPDLNQEEVIHRIQSIHRIFFSDSVSKI